MFKNLFGKKVPVPVWATNFSQSEWNDFVKDLPKAMALRNLEAEFDWEKGLYKVKGDESAFGMENISRSWLNVDTQHRLKMLVDFLDKVVVDQAAMKAEVENPHEALRIRIYPSDAFPEEVAQKTVMKPFSQYAHQVLVADFPTVIKTVTKSQLEDWQMSEDEAWSIGLENLSRYEHCQVHRVELAKTIPITAVEREMYGASMIFCLERYLVPTPENGAYVLIPTRDVLYWCAIPDNEDPNMKTELGKFAVYAYQTHPGAASPELFTWKSGKIEAVGVFNPSS